MLLQSCLSSLFQWASCSWGEPFILFSAVFWYIRNIVANDVVSRPHLVSIQLSHVTSLSVTGLEAASLWEEPLVSDWVTYSNAGRGSQGSGHWEQPFFSRSSPTVIKPSSRSHICSVWNVASCLRCYSPERLIIWRPGTQMTDRSGLDASSCAFLQN